MAVTRSEMYMILRARDEASMVLRNFSNNMRLAGKEVDAAQMALFGRGRMMATAGVAMGVLGFIGVSALNKLTNAAIEYNLAATTTFTQVDTLGVKLKDLEKIGLDVAKALPVAFDEIQPALYDIFSSMDVNKQQSAALLMGIGRAAVAGQTDMQTAARGAIAVLNAYKLPASQVNKVNDTMFQLVRKGVGTYHEFTSVIGRAVPSAIKAGQSFEDLAGMMAFMTRAGLSTAMASNSAARALDTLSKPAVILNLKKMGVAVYDAKGNFKPMVDIIDELKVKFKDMGPVMRAMKMNELFKGSGANIQTMRFLSLALADTTGQYRIMTKFMKDSAGVADEAYKKIADSPAMKLELLKNRFKNIQIAIGKYLIFIKMIFVEVFNFMFNGFNKLPEGFKQFLAVGAAVVTTFVLIGGTILMIAGLIRMLSVLWELMMAKAVKAAITETIAFATTAKTAIVSTATQVRAFAVKGALYIKDAIIAMAWAVRSTAAWMMVSYQANLSATATIIALLKIQAAWVAARIKIMAQAAWMAAAWLIAMGPIGWAILGVAAIAVVGIIVKMWSDASKKTAEGADAVARESEKGGYKVGTAFMKGVVRGHAIANGNKGFTKLGMAKPAMSEADKLAASWKNQIANTKKGTSDYAKQLAELEKYLASLTKGDPKGKTPPAAVADPIALRTATLTKSIKAGAKQLIDAKKLMTEASKAFGSNSDTKDLLSKSSSLQAEVDKLGKMTKPQLKKLGVAGIQALIDGIKSKEDALQKAMVQIQYKLLLREDIFRTALAKKSAGELNAGIARMVGDLGKTSSGETIAFKIGADVIQAYAKGMASMDAEAMLAARKTLEDSIQTAYEATKGQLEQNVQDLKDKMKSYADSISSAVKAVFSFGDAYQGVMDKAKKASEALADTNRITLEKVQAAYEIDLAKKRKTFEDITSAAEAMASNIHSALVGALDFKKAIDDANMDEVSFMDELLLQAERATLFGERIKKLIAAGLNPSALSQVISAGAEAGGIIADQLLEGGAATINKANVLVKAVDDLATTISNSVNASYYQTGINQAQAILDGFIAGSGPDSPARLAMIASMDAAVITMANTMGDTFLTTLQLSADGVTAYSDKIKQLIALGISPEALTEVLAAGTVAGNAIADSLIKGGVDQVKKVNDLVVAVDTIATTIGLDAAKKYYQAGIDTAQKILDGFMFYYGPDGKGRAAIMASMDSLAESMNRTATITITTVTNDTGSKGITGGGGGNIAPVETSRITNADGSITVFWSDGTTTKIPAPPKVYNKGQNKDRNYDDEHYPGARGNQYITVSPTIYEAIDADQLAADLGWEIASRVRL